MPLGAGANISNIGFHAPPQEPGWANDGISDNQGYSSTPWSSHSDWRVLLLGTRETFAQNQNANAIRFGTLYNFRFDADQPPQTANATVGYFKTGSPMTVAIQAPAGAVHQHRLLLPLLRRRDSYSDCHSHTNSDRYGNSYANTDIHSAA